MVQDFTNGTDFEPPTLSIKGGTNYSKAVNLALDITEARKQSYRDGGIAYYRSLVYFLTDGYPEHDNDADLARAATRLSEMEQNRSVAFFCFGIGSPDLPADMSALTTLAPRQPVELTNMEQLDGSIQWLSPLRSRRIRVPARRQHPPAAARLSGFLVPFPDRFVRI